MALDEERLYLQLKYTPREELPEGVAPKYPCQAVESFRSTLPKHPASAKSNGGDFFLPIGWFVENRGMEYAHLTRYVCMLNVSTQPVSMWAVYDYRAYNHEDDTFTDLENLTRIYMEDVLDWTLTQNPVTGVRAVMGGKDLVLLYEDIKDWHPDGATVWNKPGKEKYLLGKSVRVHADVLPPKELLDAITVKDGKQEPETCKDNAIYPHTIHVDNFNQPTGKEDAVNGSAITADTGHTVDEYLVNHGDAVMENAVTRAAVKVAAVQGGAVQGGAVQGGAAQGDAVTGDAVKGDAVMGDAVRENVVKGDAFGKPTAQKSTINDVAKSLSPNILVSEVLPTKAKPKRTASRTMLAGPPARKQRNK